MALNFPNDTIGFIFFFDRTTMSSSEAAAKMALLTNQIGNVINFNICSE